MPDATIWTLLIAAIIAVLQAVATWVQLKTKQAAESTTVVVKQAAESATKDAQDVKDALVGADAKVDEVAKIAGSTLDKVNSAHGISLETIAFMCRKEANRTKKFEDVADAEHAEKSLAEHVEMERLSAEKQKEKEPEKAAPVKEPPPALQGIKQIVSDTNERVRDLENEVEKK